MTCSYDRAVECVGPDTGEKLWACPVLSKDMTAHWCILCRTNAEYFDLWSNNAIPAVRRPTPRGPGTKLYRILRSPTKVLGHRFDVAMLRDCGCGCGYQKYAAKMDAWGVKGCRKRLKIILGYLKAEAEDTLGIPFEEEKARTLVRWAIRAAEHSEQMKQKPKTKPIRFAKRQARQKPKTKLKSPAKRLHEHLQKRSGILSLLQQSTDYAWKHEEKWTIEARELLKKTEILVKSFQRHAVLLRYIQSVRQFYPDIRIRIADDSFQKKGETNSTVDMIRNMPGISWHSMPYDSGLSAGRNLCVRESSAEFMIVTDDDFIFEEWTSLEALLFLLVNVGTEFVGGLVRIDGRVAQNWCGDFSIHSRHKQRTLLMKPPSSKPEQFAGIRFQRCNITYNFFAARREYLLAHPWDDQYKISKEHIDSFLTWWEAGARVAYTIDCVCGHDRKGNTGLYRKKRRRRTVDNVNAKHGFTHRQTMSITRFPGV